MLAVTIGAAAGCASGAGGPTRADTVSVQVSVSNCGKGWTDHRAGEQQLTLHDTDSRSGEADVIDSRGAVYAEVEPIGPGTTQTLDVSLAAGRYTLRCAMDDEPAVTGPMVTVTGHASGTTPGVQPVDQGDLVAATQQYEKYVERRLPVLLADSHTLQRDIRGGALADARRDWLPAQLAYLSMGAAYDAFGDAADDIDARADGFPNGVHDTGWLGLHRIEYGLWHGQSASTLTAAADDLVTEVQALQRAFPTAQIDPLDMAIRAHEITEDAVGFALTGRDDYGAHAGLAEVAADDAATRIVLGFVRPLLTSRYPGLHDVDTQLAETTRDVDALRRDGAWPALSALPLHARELVNADVSELAELLAPVASILEPRRTS